MERNGEQITTTYKELVEFAVRMWCKYSFAGNNKEETPYEIREVEREDKELVEFNFQVVITINHIVAFRESYTLTESEWEIWLNAKWQIYSNMYQRIWHNIQMAGIQNIYDGSVRLKEHFDKMPLEPAPEPVKIHHKPPKESKHTDDMIIVPPVITPII